jgi:hypothetical protein
MVCNRLYLNDFILIAAGFESRTENADGRPGAGMQPEPTHFKRQEAARSQGRMAA